MLDAILSRPAWASVSSSPARPGANEAMADESGVIKSRLYRQIRAHRIICYANSARTEKKFKKMLLSMFFVNGFIRIGGK